MSVQVWLGPKEEIWPIQIRSHSIWINEARAYNLPRSQHVGLGYHSAPGITIKSRLIFLTWIIDHSTIQYRNLPSRTERGSKSDALVSDHSQRSAKKSNKRSRSVNQICNSVRALPPWSLLYNVAIATRKVSKVAAQTFSGSSTGSTVLRLVKLVWRVAKVPLLPCRGPPLSSFHRVAENKTELLQVTGV